jgi:hypothetical protein
MISEQSVCIASTFIVHAQASVESLGCYYSEFL